MRTAIIVQARMTSTRLPGKVLLQVAGKPLLEYQIERLRRVKQADELVIATTVNAADDPIVALCRKLRVSYYRGSEHDVLARYYEAAVKVKADAVVRVTSDCPLIAPGVIDEVIDYFIRHSPRFDYVSNCLARTFPRGMDTEVFSFKALEAAYREAAAQPEREHVTPFIQLRPERFAQANVSCDGDFSRYRWTVDTVEDLSLITKMLEVLYPANSEFSLKDCLRLLEEHPDWETINYHIEQKKYGD